MVLIKLWLNLKEKDLAYRFGVSQATVSRIFRKWIAIMAERLRPLIHWPDRAELRETILLVFRRFFPKCVCILDSTELFIERPSDLKARAQFKLRSGDSSCSVTEPQSRFCLLSSFLLEVGCLIISNHQ